MKAQLNVRLEKSLVLQAQKAAKQQGRTLAACVAMALEQWLAAPSSAPQEPLPINRLDELEKRLERLEQLRQPMAKKAQLGVAHTVGVKAAHPPVTQAPRAEELRVAHVVPAGEAIPTDELARLLNIKRNTLNGRIRRAGGVAPGLMLEGWRCLGLVVPEGGGQAQALWQQA
jgi:hypothetical protein